MFGFSLRRMTAACAVLALAALPGFIATSACAASAPQTATVGQKAPDFTLQDTNGQSHSLSDYAGKVVVLEWTNHGCPYVQKYYNSGRMQALQADVVENHVIWLTINSSAPGKQGYTTPEEANALIAETGASATARLLDPKGKVGRLYEAKTTPHMYVIDENGTLVYAGAIDDKPTADPASLEGAQNYVLAALKSLRAGEPVEPSLTKAYGCAVKYAD